jgi:hypothetical protein
MQHFFNQKLELRTLQSNNLQKENLKTLLY